VIFVKNKFQNESVMICILWLPSG